MKIVKKLAIALLVIFIIMQFFVPEKNVSSGDHTAYFITETNPSASLKVVLKESCFDCHSNSTRYPWYNNVAPISYWISNHVKDGKKHLNFSEWKNYSLKKKDHKLEEIQELVEEGEMPLTEYTWTHEEASLTEDQINEISKWVQRTRTLYQLNQQPK